jgi:pimeloyl-ACP methyl ester carboxylesterase
VFADSGGARLAYDVSGGSGDGADVLLLHAGVTDRRSWAETIAALAPRHRCIAYDARGYGETTYERDDGWSPVADAIAVLDATGTDRAVVVGASMGGKTALDLALAHPERVVALLLIGPAVRGAPDFAPTEGPTAELEARIAATEDLEELDQLEAWMWLDGPSARGRVTGAKRDLFIEMNGKALRAEDPGDQAPIPSAWDRLETIAVPTQFLVGRLDHEEIITLDQHAAERIPPARLTFLDGVAHVPHYEGDPATLAAIAAFADAQGRL